MVYSVFDVCPHCWKRNVKFRLTILDRLKAAEPGLRKAEGRMFSGHNAYGAVWICQNCSRSVGASIFVVL